LPCGTQNAATLIRQRRSALRFDARARLPFDAWPEQARVHVLLFAHRVDGLAPGAELLRQYLPANLRLLPVPNAPPDAPLLCLSENPALAGTLRTLNCHQTLGADAMQGFALLAEFNPFPDPAAYRQRFQEAGLIGPVRYLEAEALDLRGTGIGCFLTTHYAN
jgi:hypothetical protein